MISNSKAKCKAALHFGNSIVDNDKVLEEKGCHLLKHCLINFEVRLEDL